VSENRLCIGQEKVEENSNEITAIPKVLASLDLIDAVVSIDSIGTQTKIAEQIIDQRGHYFLSVKGNQQGLLEDVEHAFKVNQGTVFTDEIESNHGRMETRQCSMLSAKNYLLEENIQAWKQVATLIKIEESREIKGVLHQ
jgi:predicted transposase YbfD/YdcC